MPVAEILVDDGWRYTEDGIWSWKIDKKGLWIEDDGGKVTFPRTRGEPVTCRKILALVPGIVGWCKKIGVDPALAVMTVATEADCQLLPYTGSESFRWEGKGRYSIGPFQVLNTTALDVIKRYGALRAWWGNDVTFEDLFPEVLEEPESRDEIPYIKGGDIPYNVPLGVGFLGMVLATVTRHTGIEQPAGSQDPILVASCYNAGGIYEPHGRKGYIPGRNPFMVHSWCPEKGRNHAVRAGEWYNDARAALVELGG